MNHVITLRPLGLSDVDTLTRLRVRNRDFLAPFEPARDADYYTRDGQAEEIERALASAAAGTTVSYVIESEGDFVGRITLNNIVRGPLQSANVGYWVDQTRTGHGVASAALAAIADLAFGEHELHRLEAGTLVHNVASQRVLAKNRFVQYGAAPRYLLISGQWQDHLLFQRLADD